MHVHSSADSRQCIVPGFLNLCLVEIVLSADLARADYVQSPMHGTYLAQGSSVDSRDTPCLAE